MGAGASVDTSIDSAQELEIFKELRVKYELSLAEPGKACLGWNTLTMVRGDLYVKFRLPGYNFAYC